MKCQQCQFDNPDYAEFCVECGAPLELICSKCGFKSSLRFKFCAKCGNNLIQNKDTPPVNYSEPQSYTPKHLADKILTTRSSLEGERKIVTVLFADVANYTAMSEKLDPEEVLQIMDGAFKIMMDETHKYEGTINQFTGDGIMAIFGAPVAHENHAQRACYTALSIQKAMSDYSAKIEREYGIDFKIRIGINSGPVIVSAIGDDLRMDYTAVGDTTNLASRMEGLADPGTVCVSGNTNKIVGRYFEFNHIGRTEVKGKEEPQDIYELIKASDVVTRIDESVAKGLTRFVGRKNSMAALMDAYDSAKSGSGQVVGVVGEAGVGKSRLILEYIFKHALTQEVAYNSLLLKRRKQIHENIGKAIEEIYAERLEEFYEMLAYHYSKSDNLKKAIQYLVSSAEKAAENYANEESYNLYTYALETFKQVPKSETHKKTKLEISIKINDPMHLLSYPDGSLEILKEGEKLSRELKDKKSLATIIGFIGRYYSMKGNPVEAIKFIEPRFFEAKKDGDLDLIAPLSVGLSVSYLINGYYFKIRDFIPEVINLIEKAKRESEYFWQPFHVHLYLCINYGASLSITGDLEQGSTILAKAMTRAYEINDKRMIALSEHYYGMSFLYKCDGENAVLHLQNAIKYSEETNWQFLLGFETIGLGQAYWLQGDLEEARKNCEKGHDIFKNTLVKYSNSYSYLVLSYIYHDSGELSKALDHITEALKLSVENHGRDFEAWSRTYFGRILGKLTSSKSEEAEKYILQGIKIFEELKMRPYFVWSCFFLGELYANIGRKDEALSNMNKALIMCQEMGIEYWPDKIQEVLDRI